MKFDILHGILLSFRSHLRSFLLPFPKDVFHDRWIVTLLGLHSGISIIPECLVKYRQHGHNLAGAQVRAEISKVKDYLKKERNPENIFRRRVSYIKEIQSRLKNASDMEFVLKCLDNKIDFLNKRSQMPQEKLFRLFFLTLDVLSGKYHRYDEGMRGFLKDILM